LQTQKGAQQNHDNNFVSLKHHALRSFFWGDFGGRNTLFLATQIWITKMQHQHGFGTHAMQAFAAQSEGYLTAFIETILQTGLSMYLGIYMFVFFVIGSLVVLGMEHFAPELAKDPFFPDSLSDLSLLVGFVYFIWVNNNMQGYEQPINNYLKFLQSLRAASQTLASTRDAEVRALLKYLVALGDNVFRPPDSMGNSEPIVKLHEFDLPQHCLKDVEKFHGDRVKMYYMAHQCLIERLMDVKKDTHAQMALPKLAEAVTQVEDHERMLRITAPVVMSAYVIAFVFLWFAVWQPMRMWARFGPFQTLWFYPIVMVVLTSPAIYRGWLGSPWKKTRPWRESEHRDWPSQFIRDIDVLFDDPLSRATKTD